MHLRQHRQPHLVKNLHKRGLNLTLSETVIRHHVIADLVGQHFDQIHHAAAALEGYLVSEKSQAAGKKLMVEEACHWKPWYWEIHNFVTDGMNYATARLNWKQ